MKKPPKRPAVADRHPGKGGLDAWTSSGRRLSVFSGQDAMGRGDVPA